MSKLCAQIGNGACYPQMNRASLACGPMVKWAIAQLQYAEMLKKVDPLRNELKVFFFRVEVQS